VYGQPVKTAALLTVALALALASAAPAHAGWKINRSLSIAQHVWHPACGQLTVAFGDPAKFGVPLHASEWAYEGECTIGLHATLITHLEFEEVCTIIMHGAGHAAGAEHSTNRKSVMFADPFVHKITARIKGRTVTHWDGADRRCLNRGRPFLERHGLL
jgi:hypothetical protein